LKNRDRQHYLTQVFRLTAKRSFVFPLLSKSEAVLYLSAKRSFVLQRSGLVFFFIHIKKKRIIN